MNKLQSYLALTSKVVGISGLYYGAWYKLTVERKPDDAMGLLMAALTLSGFAVKLHGIGETQKVVETNQKVLEGHLLDIRENPSLPGTPVPPDTPRVTAPPA